MSQAHDQIGLTADNARQQYQLDFLASGRELSLGSLDGLPFSLSQLQATRPDSPWVVQSFQGLTAHVYRISDGQQHWTLKRKRDAILVKNIDGQTSFLNEVQRRCDLHRLQQGPQGAGLAHIVRTCYASLRQGVILSPWIEGQHPAQWDRPLLESLFQTLIQLELSGLFEWDLCSGNLLQSGADIKLYDFGYMYRFDPLCEFNSNGTADPLFHAAERFETRFYFGHLLALERQSETQALQAFALEKAVALAAYERKYRILEQRRALPHILEWLRAFLQRWEQGLASAPALERLYRLESHRSMVLDLMDDLHGQSCTAGTLQKADRILHNLEQHFSLLKQNEGLFFGDERLDRASLLTKYRGQRQLAERYQLH